MDWETCDDEPQDRLDDNLREEREQSNNNNIEANNDEGDESENEVNESENEGDESENKGDESEGETDESKDENNDKDEAENDVQPNQDENVQNVRRSSRKDMQRVKIKPDKIGECDDKNDKDYR